MPQNIMEGICEPIELEPFVHQVGGHSSMLKYDDNTVCKPLISREHRFYEAMPNDMRVFAPGYRGIIEVAVQEDDGYLTLVACPVDDESDRGRQGSGTKRSLTPGTYPNSGGEEAKSDSDSECNGARAGGSAKQRFRIQKSGSIEIEGVPDKVKASVEHSREKQKILCSSGPNPWSLLCHKEQLAKMHKSFQDSNKAHKFILLEDVASQFECPCILDLKMGRRQHGDQDSEEKRLSKIERCEKTTSYKLGVRICGMQVYQRDTGNFLCHNKYYGRKLDENGVEACLKQFLHNGCRLRLDLIDHIIEKLSRLYEVLKKQNTFRFYSSSLLIMYDGNEEEEDITDLDSSESSFHSGTFRDESYSSTSPIDHHNHHPNHDQELLCVHHGGMDATGSSSDSSKCPVCCHNAGIDEQHSNNEAGSCSYSGSVIDGGNTSTSSSSGAQPNNHHRHHHHKSKVDVRMIDFAHTTFLGFRGDKTNHEGPDHGYLFGMSNLIGIFKSLKEQYRSPMDE